jgi:acyl-CoA reductase-like NAD-dependent aldehyde dehydrogenase
VVCINDLAVFRYQQLIKENLGEIAKLITVEQGKTLPDAEGDVMRGLQVERYLLIRIQIRNWISKVQCLECRIILAKVP